MKFQQQRASWQRTLDSIKLEELQIGYAEGKVIEQNKQNAASNLETASKIAARALRQEDLADEINFMETIDALGHTIQDISALLLDMPSPMSNTSPRIGAWAQSLTQLADGPVNGLYLDTYKFVMARAEEVERKNWSGGSLKPE